MPLVAEPTAADRLLATLPATLPESLGARRIDGLAAFRAAGLPGRRSEAWRYTSLEGLAATAFQPSPAESKALARRDTEAFAIRGLDAVQVVMVDGVFRPDLSDSLAGLGAGVVAGPLDAVLAAHPALVLPHLGRLAGEAIGREGEAFTALNQAALGRGGFCLVIPDGATARPLRLLSLKTAASRLAADHPRLLVVAGRGARGQVIEQHCATDDALVYLRNAVTEIVAAEEAKVEHYVLENDAQAAFHVSSLFIEQQARSDVHTHTVLLGGALVRNNVAPTLQGSAAHCLINGLYLGRGRQHLDNAMRVHHAAQGCLSRQYYKGILCDQSRGVFSGRIIVDRVAQQTDAIQQSRSMLLSGDARVNTRPQLEIYADDVRCTHGATTGQVDDEALFYFRSRGIAEPVARAMLVYAFAAEGFGRMELEPVRWWLARELVARLPMAQGLGIEELATGV